jgi:hypothetical protein
MSGDYEPEGETLSSNEDDDMYFSDKENSKAKSTKPTQKKKKGPPKAKKRNRSPSAVGDHLKNRSIYLTKETNRPFKWGFQNMEIRGLPLVILCDLIEFL